MVCKNRVLYDTQKNKIREHVGTQCTQFNRLIFGKGKYNESTLYIIYDCFVFIFGKTRLKI